MAVSYSWKVTQITKKAQEGTDNVVVHTRWKLTGTESSTGTEGSFLGATPLEYDPSNSGSFVPWEDLTEETVIGWLQGIVVDNYWDHVTDSIQKQIDKVDDPADVLETTDLPWATAESGSSPSPDLGN